MEQGGTCEVPLPLRRATRTQAVLNRDGRGFLLMSMWYVPDDRVRQGGHHGTARCHHHGRGSAQGLRLADEPVTSPVVVNNRIVVLTSAGVIDIGAALSAAFTRGSSSATQGRDSGNYRKLNWREVP